MAIYLKSFKQIHELWNFLPKSRKKQFQYYVLIIFISAIIELASIGALIPFLAVLSGNGDAYINKIPFLDWNEIRSKYNFFYIATFAFLILNAFSYGIRFLLLNLQIEFSQGVGHDISVNIYTNTLNQPYLNHKINPTSKIISILVTKVNSVVYNTVLPSANICSAFLILFTVFITGLILSPIITMGIIVGFSIFYLTVIRLIKNSIKSGGSNIAEMQNTLLSNIQISLGGIRDIVLDNTQNHYINNFSKIDSSLRSSISKIQLNSSMPRFILELIAIYSLIGFSIFSKTTNPNESEMILPLLGFIAYVGQRLLPLFQQLYSSYTTILGDQKTMGDVLEFIRMDNAYNDRSHINNLQFNKKIELRNLYFHYKPTEFILNDCNLTIKKGDRVGIIGDSGSGKSTLLDIIMGLLIPSSGFLYIDDVFINSGNIQSWQSMIGHVPQNIYLSQGSIAENVAFGINKNNIDYKKVFSCLKTAGLENYILSLPNGINSEVGERGGLLSGGQVQRIGIARALYKEPKILILDEITSALDGEIEASIMSELFSLSKDVTILMVAHKESALSYCDYLVGFEGKTLLKK